MDDIDIPPRAPRTKYKTGEYFAKHKISMPSPRSMAVQEYADSKGSGFSTVVSYIVGDYEPIRIIEERIIKERDKDGQEGREYS